MFLTQKEIKLRELKILNTFSSVIPKTRSRAMLKTHFSHREFYNTIDELIEDGCLIEFNNRNKRYKGNQPRFKRYLLSMEGMKRLRFLTLNK